MTNYETVSVSELEVGDTVRFCGLEFQLKNIQSDSRWSSLFDDNLAGGWAICSLPNEATVEREVKPKTVKLQLTMESLPLDQALGIYNICPVTSPQIAEIKARHGWVVTDLSEVTE